MFKLKGRYPERGINLESFQHMDGIKTIRMNEITWELRKTAERFDN